MTPEFADSASAANQTACSRIQLHLLGAGTPKKLPYLPSISVGDRNMNSGPQTCIASALLRSHYLNPETVILKNMVLYQLLDNSPHQGSKTDILTFPVVIHVLDKLSNGFCICFRFKVIAFAFLQVEKRRHLNKHNVQMFFNLRIPLY